MSFKKRDWLIEKQPENKVVDLTEEELEIARDIHKEYLDISRHFDVVEFLKGVIEGKYDLSKLEK